MEEITICKECLVQIAADPHSVCLGSPSAIHGTCPFCGKAATAPRLANLPESTKMILQSYDSEFSELDTLRPDYHCDLIKRAAKACLDLALDPKIERDAATEALAAQRNQISKSTGNLDAKSQSSRVSNVIMTLMGASHENQDQAFNSLSQEDKDMVLEVMEFMCNKVDAPPTLQ